MVRILPWALGAGVLGLVLLSRRSSASTGPAPSPLPGPQPVPRPAPGPRPGGEAPYYDPDEARRSEMDRADYFAGIGARGGTSRGGVNVIRHGRGGWGGGGGHWGRRGWGGWGRGWGWNTYQPTAWYALWPYYQSVYGGYAQYPGYGNNATREAYVRWQEALRTGADAQTVAILKQRFDRLIFGV